MTVKEKMRIVGSISIGLTLGVVLLGPLGGRIIAGGLYLLFSSI